MKARLPESENPLVIRTDFSNSAAWDSIRKIVQESHLGEFGTAFVDIVDDQEWFGITKDKLLRFVPEDYVHPLVILADRTAVSHPEFPLLIVDLLGKRGREFRAIPSAVGLIAANLSVGEMVFEEFSQDVDEDGVFRGSPEGEAEPQEAPAGKEAFYAADRLKILSRSMRTVAIPVHNNQKVEVFSQRRGDGQFDGFEVWMVGVSKGERMILDHLLTQEHLERRVCYARAGDLVWTEAQPSSLPIHKHRAAQQSDEVVKRGTFLDLASPIHYFNAINLISPDRKTSKVAAKALLGRWTDGIATITFEPGFRLLIGCPEAGSHPLYNVAHCIQADWWSFGQWDLMMLNEKEKRGERVQVFRCDERELHIVTTRRDVLVHVFHRADQPF